jgi:hypothetical protein
MQAPETPSRADSTQLVATLRECSARAAGGTLTLGEVLDSVQEASYAFICMVLCLPFLQPLSLGPLAVAGGLTFALLGWQCLTGHHTPVLPAKVRNIVMKQQNWELLIRTCIRMLGWCSRISAPRYFAWVDGARGHRVFGVILTAGGLLMSIPFFGLPFNNALPALAIFFVSLAQLERDGLMVFVAIGWLVVTVLYFVAIVGALWWFGRSALGLPA